MMNDGIWQDELMVTYQPRFKTLIAALSSFDGVVDQEDAYFLTKLKQAIAESRDEVPPTTQLSEQIRLWERMSPPSEQDYMLWSLIDQALLRGTDEPGQGEVDVSPAVSRQASDILRNIINYFNVKGIDETNITEILFPNEQPSTLWSVEPMTGNYQMDIVPTQMAYPNSESNIGALAVLSVPLPEEMADCFEAGDITIVISEFGVPSPFRMCYEATSFAPFYQVRLSVRLPKLALEEAAGDMFELTVTLTDGSWSTIELQPGKEVSMEVPTNTQIDLHQLLNLKLDWLEENTFETAGAKGGGRLVSAGISNR